jgi:hypothetical protein
MRIFLIKCEGYDGDKLSLSLGKTVCNTQRQWYRCCLSGHKKVHSFMSDLWIDGNGINEMIEILSFVTID